MTPMFSKKIIILFFLMCMFCTYSLQANEKPSQAKLISLFKKVQPDSFIDIGVYITLKKGWHTYWKNPGDLGQSLTWPQSSAFSMSPMIWPAPQRIHKRWIQFVHKKHLLVKRKVYIPKNIKNISISSTIKWLVCKTSCIPMSQEVHLNLPTGEPIKDVLSQKIFQSFIYPTALDLTGKIEKQKNKDRLFIQSSQPFKLIDFFPIQNLSHKSPDLQQSSPSSYVLSLPQSKKNKNHKALIVLRKDQTVQAGEIDFAFENNSFILILAMAFLGGLILNFMPCVLPVVFLKFYHTASIPRGKLIASSLSYGGGILLSFLSLAFLIQLLKTGGQTAGWGFQMESPLFVSFLIFLFTLIGLSFLELLPIPVFLKKSKTQESLAGSFLSGLLITATASPCTAPFMGAAVGYAFSRSLLEILFVFSSLGLGLASPYFFLCFFPKLLKYFPHPGSWNRKLKYAMSLPMFSAVLWLCSILYQLLSLNILGVFSALLLLTLVLWLKKNQHIKQKIFIALLCLSFLPALYTVFYLEKSQQSLLQKGEVFSLEKLNKLKKTNPVLLYFTAPWCLSCQVNEWTTLKNKNVLEFLNQNKIILMKVQWDPGHPDIAKIFEKHKRAGIPFTLFFPLEGQELVLPEILTPHLLMSFLRRTSFL